MGEQMTFPNTWEEYEEFYGFTDSERVYTNGARLIPSFRVEQWLDHKNVHGEWHHISSTGWECSACGRVVTMRPIDKKKTLYNFCPNCGALMSESLKTYEIAKAISEGLNEGLNCGADARGEENEQSNRF